MYMSYHHSHALSTPFCNRFANRQALLLLVMKGFSRIMRGAIEGNYVLRHADVNTVSTYTKFLGENFLEFHICTTSPGPNASQTKKPTPQGPTLASVRRATLSLEGRLA